jgi:DNA polymerase III sliding clamp (beta) subunit (PCNA family)
MKIVCPARTLTEISRMLDVEEDLKIYASNNLLSVGVKDTFITSRLYLGEFVKKENVFPAEFTTCVKINKNEIVNSVERASVLIRGDKNNLISFDIKADKIVITANSEMGKVEETVNAELDGKELKIMPSYPSNVVDTTAAGDSFTAAMALEYIRSGDIYAACDMGNRAGSIAVSRMGAENSMPTAEELKNI